jgi:outer membrane lipoprotein-sorting protein
MSKFILPVALVLMAAPVLAQAPNSRADSIVAEADRRQSGFGDYTAAVTMTLRDTGGSARVREMRILGLEAAEDGDKTLVIFDVPRDLEGTSILTVTHRDSPSDQWLYLPAIRRTRRIATSNRSDAFMGSEFTFEDIGSQDLNEYRYRYLREEALDGTAAYVLERFPIDEQSAYARHVMWMDSEEYQLLRVDYYDRDDAHVKSLRVDGYQQYDGGQWRPDRMVMNELASGKSTTLDWSDYAFATGLSDGDFDPRRLGRR